MSNSNRVLLKLRSQSAVQAALQTALAAAGPQAAKQAAKQINLRPLHDPVVTAAPLPLGLAAAPAWYIADLPDTGPTPWDRAHAQLADRLGIAESEILFAEPDLAHTFPDLNERNRGDQPFAIDSNCQEEPQRSDGGRVTGQGFAW